MHHTSEHRSPDMNECIQNCTECHQICVETISYCIDMGGTHVAAEHMKLLQACAAICSNSVDSMLAGVSVSAAVCGACAEVCRACAAACEQFAEDAAMKRCAEACRRSEKSCAAMAAMAS